MTKYAIEPGLTTATFAMVMNPAKYKSLPADLQAIIDKTTGVAAAESFGKAWTEAEARGRKLLIAKGLEIITLPESEIQEMKKRIAPRVEQAIADLEKKGEPAREFYEAYTK